MKNPRSSCSTSEVVHSWVDDALTYFTDDLQELEQLQAEQRERDACALETAVKHASREVDIFLATQPHLTPSRSLAPTHMSNKARPNNLGNNSVPSHTKSDLKMKIERERLVTERLRAFEASQVAQPFRKQLIQYECHLNEWQHKLRSIRASEESEYNFFTAKGEGFYTMDDVLSTNVRGAAATVRAIAATPDVLADNRTTEQAEEPSNTVDRVLVSSFTPSNVFLGVDPASVVVDCGRFAQEYNEALTCEYGYRPILERSTASPSSIDGDPNLKIMTQYALLGTHQPGMEDRSPQLLPQLSNKNGLKLDRSCAVKANDTRCSTVTDYQTFVMLPNRLIDSLDGRRKADQVRLRTPDARKVLRAPAVELCPSIPSLPRCDEIEQSAPNHRELPTFKNIYDNSTKGRKRTMPKFQMGSCTASSSTTINKTEAAKAHKSGLLMGIECSASNNQTTLRTVAGKPASVLIRFTNRNEHRMRFRLKPSTDKCLDYSCVRVAPVAGTTTNVGKDKFSTKARAGVPIISRGSEDGIFLSCGGYMEVRIVFTPADSSTQKLDTILYIGITRELNSLSMEGSQWSFFEVAVSCETLLPFFQLFHAPDNSSQGNLIDSFKSSNPVMTSTISKSVDSQPVHCSDTTDLNSYAKDYSGMRPLSREKTINFQRSLTDLRADAIRSGVDHSLLPFCGSVPLDECIFPPTFVLSSITQHYLLTNIGSNAVVSLGCTSQNYAIHPSGPVELAYADTLKISITFKPMECEDHCNDQLVLTIRGDSLRDQKFKSTTFIADQNDITSQKQHFLLRGRSVVPQIILRQIGEMSLPDNASSLTFCEQNEDGESINRVIPRYFIPDTCPEVCSTLVIRVFNSCVLPLAYRWILQACSRGAAGEGQSDDSGTCPCSVDDVQPFAIIEPLSGTMPPMQESTFTVSVRPRCASKVVLSCNLFLEDLPDPAEIPSVALQHVPSWIVKLYDHCKVIPCALPAIRSVPGCQQGELLHENHDAAAGLLSRAVTSRVLTDPFAFFQAYTCLQPDHLRGFVFSTGFYLFAFPTDPSLSMRSELLNGIVECLTGLEVSRRVVLQNPSPRTLHFSWNTPDKTFRRAPKDAAMVISEAGGKLLTDEKNLLSVSCRPREGYILAHGELDVVVSFVVHTPGLHRKRLECSVPELRACYELNFQVKGVSPTVHVSTQFLDFGIIRLGTQATAAFNVCNNNTVSVRCSFRDPLQCHPLRFTFSPSSVHLASNESAEVLVHRDATTVGREAAFFEVVVDQTVVAAVETHAIVQAPQIIVENRVVDFGYGVPEGIWQEGYFYLSNSSEFEIEFAIEATPVLNPCVRLEYAPRLRLGAGQKQMPVLVRACFSHEKSNLNDCCAYLLIHSDQTEQEIPLEVRASAIERLSVSVDVHIAAKTQEEVYDPGDDPCTAVGLVMPIEKYIRALLLNALEVVWGTVHHPSPVPHPEQVASTCTKTVLECNTNTPFHFTDASPKRVHKTVVHPLCEDVNLSSELPDHSPVCSERLVVKFRNYSKCVTRAFVREGSYSSSSMVSFVVKKTLVGATCRTAELPLTASILSNEADLSSVQPGNSPSKADRSVVISPPSYLGKTKLSKISDNTQHASPFIIREWVRSSGRGFWTTQTNGVAEQQHAHQAALLGAQRLLLDGKGCCIDLSPVPPTGLRIGPLEEASLPLSLYVNLPGKYVNTLEIECEGLPCTSVSVEWEVFGHPLLLDPTTAGLTKDENGHNVLIMTPVVAFLGSSHRVLRIINRLPREVCATVEVHLSTSSLAVLAIDEDVDASLVVLTLGTLPELMRRRGVEEYGTAATTPSAFHMPALSSKDVHIEYTPNAKIVEHFMRRSEPKKNASTRPSTIPHSLPNKFFSNGPDGDTLRVVSYDDNEGDDLMLAGSAKEVEWNGCLVINCKLADSPFNDMFLIDEFYQRNEEVYPSQRVLRHYSCTAGNNRKEALQSRGKVATRGVREDHDTSADTTAILPTFIGMLSVLQLFQPLRTRPGRVVCSGKLIEPSGREKLLLEEYHDSHPGSSTSASHLSTPRQFGTLLGSSMKAHYNDETSGSDVDYGPDGGPGNSKDSIIFERSNHYSTRALSVLLSEDKERAELIAYMKQRRSQLAEQSARYFKPIELRLRARCGVPRLVLDPPVARVEFEPYHDDGKACLRTIRVRNPNSAPLRFFFRLFTQKIPNLDETRVHVDDKQHITDSKWDRDKWGSFSIMSTKRHRSEEDENSQVLTTLPDDRGYDTQRKKMTKTNRIKSNTNIATQSRVLLGKDKKNSSAEAPMSEEDVCQHPIYELSAFEFLDVSIAYLPPQVPFSFSSAASVRDLWGRLNVQFIPCAAPTSTSNQAPSSYGHDVWSEIGSVPISSPEQDIPLHVPLVRPVLSCSTAFLCFYPGNIILDGRPQSNYSQRFTLYNHSSMVVEYDIISAGSLSDVVISSAGSNGYADNYTRSEVMIDSAKKPLSLPNVSFSRPSIREKIDGLLNIPPSPMLLLECNGCDTTNGIAGTHNGDNRSIQDYIKQRIGSVVRGEKASEHFILSPVKGFLPPATAGGQPGASVVEVAFKGDSNIVYECDYAILANRQPSQLLVKIMGISRVTEV